MAIKSICVDALGIFCAHQIFYTQIINEHEMKSPIKIDLFELPRFLAKSFAAYSNELHRLEIVKGDLDSDRPYKITISGMKILERDYAIDWGGGIYEF